LNKLTFSLFGLFFNLNSISYVKSFITD